MLYLVATPIGNLKDITFRALDTLFSVDIILCEDTRKTLNLLKHYQKPEQEIPRLISFFEENELKKIPEVIFEMKKGTGIALVTNSGTPAISDPGFKLIRECWKEGIKVVSIPGPCSPISALACSGLPTDKFLFLGFTPGKSSQRIKFFEQVKNSLNYLSSTVIFFESPFRIVKSLGDMESVFGDIDVVVARELTKVHEEIKKDKISNLITFFSQNTPRGEFVVLFRTLRE